MLEGEEEHSLECQGPNSAIECTRALQKQPQTKLAEQQLQQAVSTSRGRCKIRYKFSPEQKGSATEGSVGQRATVAICAGSTLPCGCSWLLPAPSALGAMGPAWLCQGYGAHRGDLCIPVLRKGFPLLLLLPPACRLCCPESGPAADPMQKPKAAPGPLSAFR